MALHLLQLELLRVVARAVVDKLGEVGMAVMLLTAGTGSIAIGGKGGDAS